MTSARRKILLNTDAASFWLAVLGMVGLGFLATVQWWHVFHAQGSTSRTGWREYYSLGLCIWILMDDRKHRELPREMRFGLGAILAVIVLKIVISLFTPSNEMSRAVSLWGALTGAIVSTVATLWLIRWLWCTFRAGHLSVG